MRKIYPFTMVLIALGFALAGVVVYDLGTRGLHEFPVRPDWPLTGMDPQRGREAIERHGCGACHVIPGIHGAHGRVGPKLEELVHQMYIAGVLANTPDNLAEWIQRPQDIHPGTAMPNLEVTEEEARDIVAYLYTAR